MRAQVTFDSGVRSAADIFKALALGAKFVFVGRLWVWGLSIAGRTGVKHIMKSLLAEFDILMNVAGYARIEDIDRDAIDSLPRAAIMPTDATVT
jgi:isopentenyl diphosphate isomerase/L-lactate dehydrogenase-like FMN-dependent dehydrogenase